MKFHLWLVTFPFLFFIFCLSSSSSSLSETASTYMWLAHLLFFLSFSLWLAHLISRQSALQAANYRPHCGAQGRMWQHAVYVSICVRTVCLLICVKCRHICRCCSLYVFLHTCGSFSRVCCSWTSLFMRNCWRFWHSKWIFCWSSLLNVWECIVGGTHMNNNTKVCVCVCASVWTSHQQDIQSPPLPHCTAALTHTRWRLRQPGSDGWQWACAHTQAHIHAYKPLHM